MPSPGKWQRQRGKAHVFGYSWIPAFAGMTQEKAKRVPLVGRHDLATGLGMIHALGRLQADG